MRVHVEHAYYQSAAMDLYLIIHITRMVSVVLVVGCSCSTVRYGVHQIGR